MIQAEMISNLATNCSITKATAKHVIDSIGDMLQEDLLANGKTVVFGLGNLTVVERAAREGRNPRTGELVSVPAKKSIKFKASITVKKAVNGV